MKLATILAIVALRCVVPTMLIAQDGPTLIKVTDEVIQSASALEPLGVNNFGDPRGIHYSAGNLIHDSGFEPIRLRKLYRVISSGQDHGRFWITLDGLGAGQGLWFKNGTFSGGVMRAYRFLDASGQPLPYLNLASAQGGRILDARNATQFAPLFSTTVVARGTPGFPEGGWLAPSPRTRREWQELGEEKQGEIKEGWRVYYVGGEQLRMDDVVFFERSFLWPDPEDFHPSTLEEGIRSVWNDVQGVSRHVALPPDAPAEMKGGEGVLEMAPVNGVAEVWDALFGGTGQRYADGYGRLEEGLTYRYEAWVKVEGTPSGLVILGLGGGNPNDFAKGYYGTPLMGRFAANGQWQRVGFEFTAPPTPSAVEVAGAIIRFEGTGRLLVDNVKLQPIYEPGDAERPFVIDRKLLAELLRNQPAGGRKGACRIWPGLSQGSMAAFCDWTPDNLLRFANRITVAPNDSMRLPKALTILEATGDSIETRMVPWIITQITHSENEYRQLVEYLAAPYDPATDSPESKPMAYKRTLQRGNNRPWTDDFREIIIEFGNENWHNRFFEGQGLEWEWLGLGRMGTVHQAGHEFGLWAKYMIQEMQKSPYWNGGVFKVCLGGNYAAGVNPDGSVKGYGQEATVAAGGINTYNSHATYIGPRWETGEKGGTSINDAGVQRTLLSYRLEKEDEWAAQEAANKQLQKLGYAVTLTAYEGGPSGFGLFAKDPEEDRASEYYGKSLAMGTALLDSWLDAWRQGWTYQCYLKFGQGRWWASHTRFEQGFRASPGFLTQGIINQTLANQDMLAVDVSNSPKLAIALPRDDQAAQQRHSTSFKMIAAIQAHATGNSHRISVAISNLGLAQSQSVQIMLPIPCVTAISRYYLRGDPRDTNLDQEAVTVIVENLDPAQLQHGAFHATIPAGLGVVYVFTK